MPLQPANHDAATRWAMTPRGLRMVSLEQLEVQRAVPDLFGRHFLQIGTWGGSTDWLEGSAMQHRAVLALGRNDAGQARVEAQRLPLAAKSVDAVLLPHTLEAVGSPHTLLREVSRVLTDRGRLLILGFNPYSVLGWRRALGIAPRGLPADARYYSTGRISDWLTLLDFEIAEVRRFGAGFPWLPARAVGAPFSPAALFAPLAENWLISAKKRVAPLNFVGRIARAQVKPLVPVTVGGVAVVSGARRAANEPDGHAP